MPVFTYKHCLNLSLKDTISFKLEVTVNRSYHSN